MSRFATLCFVLLLSTCGPTLAPAHPLKMLWEDGNIPAEVSDGGLGSEPPKGNRDVDFDELYTMCVTHKDAVICTPHRATGKDLPFEEVRLLTAAYNSKFVYRSDTALYGHGKFDYRWENWTLAGVCVDFVLTLSELFADAGENVKDMKVVLGTVDGDGHAMLKIKTADKGEVLLSVGFGQPLREHVLPFHWAEAGSISLDGQHTLTTDPGYVLNRNFPEFQWVGLRKK